jgi:hypothetical protein
LAKTGTKERKDQEEEFFLKLKLHIIFSPPVKQSALFKKQVRS